MVPSSAGAVVLLPFPFSDLSQSKLRPAVVVAAVGRGDWVCCQITSKSYGDPDAILLDAPDFATGSLHRVSFARPGKLFTANEGLFTAHVATLADPAIRRLKAAIASVLQL
jgi:mRNA interferase MazF